MKGEPCKGRLAEGLLLGEARTPAEDGNTLETWVRIPSLALKSRKIRSVKQAKEAWKLEEFNTPSGWLVLLGMIYGLIMLAGACAWAWRDVL